MLSDSEIQNKLGLDAGEVGQYIGIQIWPFAISIILFSLIIDKVGYKFSMIFAFSCQIIWTVMGYIAISSETMDLDTRKNLILWGGFILALGNGTVEAFINPVVATMFTKAKTKWLNILHAGWPGGLVLAGMLVILMEEAAWENKILLIAIPAVIYFVILIKQTFPVQERVSAGSITASTHKLEAAYSISVFSSYSFWIFSFREASFFESTEIPSFFAADFSI